MAKSVNLSAFSFSASDVALVEEASKSSPEFRKSLAAWVSTLESFAGEEALRESLSGKALEKARELTEANAKRKPRGKSTASASAVAKRTPPAPPAPPAVAKRTPPAPPAVAIDWICTNGFVEEYTAQPIGSAVKIMRVGSTVWEDAPPSTWTPVEEAEEAEEVRELRVDSRAPMTVDGFPIPWFFSGKGGANGIYHRFGFRSQKWRNCSLSNQELRNFIAACKSGRADLALNEVEDEVGAPRTVAAELKK